VRDRRRGLFCVRMARSCDETQHYDEENWILEARPIRVKISLS
jgi:hypothetical protein